MNFDKAYFDAGVNRIGTHSVKWDGMIAETGDKDMVPMWVADMDFPSPPAIQEALAQVLHQDTWGYTLSGEEDTAALCGYWKRRHHAEIDPEAVVMIPGVVTGLKLAVRTLTQPGDGIMINTPIYGQFFAAIRDNDRKIVESPLLLDEETGRYSLNMADMEDKLASGEAKALMFCSPHNPSGRAWSVEELTAVVDLCRRHDVPLICDEIHADFVYAPNEHHNILTIEGAKERTVMLCAPSKTFNLAGLQQSTLVCPNQTVREKIQRDMLACGIRSGNTFALAAARAAYTECDAWLDGLKAYIRENQNAVTRYVSENIPNVRVTPMEATYTVWLDCRGLNMEQQDIMDALCREHVKLNDGLAFGECERGFLRMNVACPRKQLEKALECLKKALTAN